MTFLRAVFCVLLLGAAGCAMIGSWRAIPPPGGCDRCHQVPVSANWSIVYVPVAMLDDEGHLPWQRPQPPATSAITPLEERMVTEQPCFDCHRGPDRAHGSYKGRYHH
jgi:hypothetical protein